MMKLSKAQQRAFNKLTKEWQSAHTLSERLSTLDALARKRPDQVERNNEVSWYWGSKYRLKDTPMKSTPLAGWFEVIKNM